MRAKTWAALARIRQFLATSYGVMAVVISNYVVKVLVKVGFGVLMFSPMMAGDGWHNASDIFQALAVIVGVYLSRRPPSKKFPFGWVALDALLALGIAASLAFAAVFNVLIPSLAGVLNALSLSDGIWSFAGSYLPSRLDTGPNALTAALIMFVSAEVSMLVSRYQIRVGTATGHASVVADGEETRSDGKIETLAGTGLLLQLATGLGWLEYLFGLAMAYVMLRTAYEIFENGRDALFSRSLGDSVEDGIRSAVDATPGIECLRSVLTYRRGNCRVADVEVQSPLGSQPRGHIERHLAERIRKVLEDTGGGGEISVTVRAVPPVVVQTRWGYLARIDGGVLRVIGDPRAATHLVVCEVANGVIRSCRDVPANADFLADVIATKRVEIVHVLEGCSGDWTYGQAEVRFVPSGDPRLLGIPLK